MKWLKIRRRIAEQSAFLHVLGQKDRRDPGAGDTVPGSVDVRRWGGMPKLEPRWLKVVIRIALDWRFLIALAVLIRVLLNK